jgi:hypothetical protein
MCRHLTCLFSLLLVLGPAGNASAELMAHWAFNEQSGAVATDLSGNGHNGMIEGAPNWVPGVAGSALEFDGIDDFVEIGENLLDNLMEFSITLWVDPVNYTSNRIGLVGQNDCVEFGFNGGGDLRCWNTSGIGNVTIAYPHQTGEWHHVAAIGDSTGMSLYIDGSRVVGPGTAPPASGYGNSIYTVSIGAGIYDAAGNWYDGKMDDVRIYNHALTEQELQAAMEAAGDVWPLAVNPAPADEAIHDATWANLSWTPGPHAVSHDVYIGESFEDVNTGAEGTFRGNQGGTFLVVGFPGFPFPDGLVPGTTYYWRIDEVNDADPNSPWKGDIWSFLVPPKKAYNPDPADDAKFIATDASLNWTGGSGAKLHHVYFGDNFDDVSNAAGAAAQADATLTPGALEMDKTYYWRVDEFDGIVTHTGDVWTFSTLPVIALHTDPNLVAWWTFDEGMGSTALDWSGHGNHGTLVDSRWITPGLHGDAGLNMGSNGYVAIENLNYAETGIREVTVCSWVRTGAASGQYIVSFDRDSYWRLEISGSGGGPGQVGWDVMTSSGQVDSGSLTRVDNEVWHHVCGVFDNGRMTIYIDGMPEPSVTGGSTFGSTNTRFGFIGANSEAATFNGTRGGGIPIIGEVDDIRIYDRALTQEEIVLVMRGDPLLAWGPNPANGSVPDVDNALPLTWSPGDMAARHDVYFGTDEDAVKNADTTGTTGIYIGSQSGTSLASAAGVDWGAGPFYWRIDENNTDGTVTKGRVWSFTVADFLLIDDFESYADNDAENEAIWQHWIDGFGVPANGSQVGNLLPPYAEQTIVHSGAQSMPLTYDNTAGVRNSEAVLALTAPRDWTKHGVGVLSLWLRGFPPSVGGFTEAPVGTFTMTAAGADIGGSADQFHFTYKTLAGTGTIVARIDSVQNTHAWAKAGVMIRETLDGDSKYALAAISAGNGVASQGRTDTASTSFSSAEAGVTAPHWVRLERDVMGNFTVSHSANGSTWIPVENSVPTNIPMASEVYVGLALTSRNAAQTCEAKFSNVTITGSVGPQWMHQDVGIQANNAEPLYVALSNGAGAPAIVVHEDANASVTDVWTEWIIDLQAFADQGLNLADVDKIAIGLGAKANPAATGGTGTVFIDDIRLYQAVSQQP